MKTLLVLAAACAAVSAQTGAGRIAVFDDDLPGLETGPVQSAIRVLEGAGLGCQRVHLRDLASRDAFSTERFDTLVLNHSHHLSPAARENLTDFLKAGGDLVMLGASGFLHRQSMTLPAFSRYEPYTLEGTETVDTAGGQEIVPAVEARGKFNGFSAVGFTRRAARFTPLLAAKDRYGRVRGWACGLLTHFAEYPGSNWLLFGIDTPEFYSSDAFARTLRAALGRMKGDELARAAEAEHQKAIGTRIRLTSRAPAGFVHLSPDGKHLVGADGKRLFLTGVNYHRGLDQGEWSQGTFDDTVFEDDFRKAHEAGINFIRLGPAARFYDSPEIVKECARKYGIYLIIILNWGTRRDFAENAERVAQMYAGEPMVIGYDLQNEPAADALAALPYDGKASPVLALQNEKPLASRVEAAALEAALAPPQRAGAGGAPRRAASAGSLPQGDPRELAAFRLLWPKAWDAEMRNSASVFPGLNGPPAEGGYGYLRDAMDQTLGLWIAKHVEAIRKHDKEHLISVGYNNILAALPANRQLQFLTHHVY